MSQYSISIDKKLHALFYQIKIKCNIKMGFKVSYCPKEFGASLRDVTVSTVNELCGIDDEEVDLTIYVLFFPSEHKHVFYIIDPHWHDTGSWSLSSYKTRTYLCYIVNAMATDGLATPGCYKNKFYHSCRGNNTHIYQIYKRVFNPLPNLSRISRCV